MKPAYSRFGDCFLEYGNCDARCRLIKFMGALTSKPYAFSARSWELKSFDSIDLNDSIGSNIRIDTRGSDILRILPRTNDNLNEVWITDKVRFSYDGLSSQRLNTPLYRAQRSEPFSRVSWLRLFAIVKKYLPYSESSVDFSFSNQSSFETMSRIKHFLGNLTKNPSFNESYSDLSENYLFNTPASRIEESDMFLILGINLRLEAPSVNIKIRKVLRNNPSVKVFSVGSTAALSTTYPVVNLGDLASFWGSFFKGKHKLSKFFYKSKTPCVIANLHLTDLSNSVRALANSSSIFNKIWGKGGWYGLNFLSLDASSNSLHDLSLSFLNSSVPNMNKRSSFTSLYNFGNDNLIFESGRYDFITYQGHHGDFGASNANLIVPTLHPYESSTTSYLNVYGDFQFVSKVRTFGQSVLSNADILGYISERLDITKVLNPSWFKLRYFTINDYSFRATLINLKSGCNEFLDSSSWLLHNPLNSLDSYSYRFGLGVTRLVNGAKRLDFTVFSRTVFDLSPLNPRYFSFYVSDSSTRASHIMALSQSRFKQPTSFYN